MLIGDVVLVFRAIWYGLLLTIDLSLVAALRVIGEELVAAPWSVVQAQNCKYCA